MKIFAQNSRCPSQVLFAFDEVTAPGVRRIRWAVAYATRRGCDRLVQRIGGRIGRRDWESSEKEFVLSLDFGLTEPEALQYLVDLPESTVRIAAPDVIRSPGLNPQQAFHPKLYLFDDTELTGYVVGSANLTERALISNSEIVAAGRDAPEQGDWEDAWNTIVSDAQVLTTGLLNEYRAARNRLGRPVLEVDTRPPAPRITPNRQPVFWDAVTAGVSPEAFNQFWIETGAMSSGGSHNQLELPRGGNRFFGFGHAAYGAAHVTIGHPPLTLRNRRWTHRPLTWHGHNRMERINLPTRAQGGFDYRNSAVLFRRHHGGFEIEVLPWNDDGAVAWRAASATLRTMFRLGERGHRLCGLF